MVDNSGMNFNLFLWLLAASGRHARILLPLGVLLALLLPSSGAFFKPAAPYILAVLIGAALVRLDIGAVLKAALQPQRLIRNFAISLGLLFIVPLVFLPWQNGLAFPIISCHWLHGMRWRRQLVQRSGCASFWDLPRRLRWKLLF